MAPRLDDSKPKRDLTLEEVMALDAAPLAEDEDEEFTDDNGDRGDDEMNRRDIFGVSALERDFQSYDQ